MVVEIAARHWPGPIARVARLLASAVMLVAPDGNTACGEAKMMNNAPPKDSDLGHLTGEQWQRPLARPDTKTVKKTVNTNPRAKWPSVHFDTGRSIRRGSPLDETSNLRTARTLSSASSTSPSAELVTLAHAADSLGVHYMTAYRYVRTGRMVAEKRGGKWWVASADLAAVLAEGTGPRRRVTDHDNAPRQLVVAPFTDRLVAGDTAGCWNIINDALSAGATPGQIHSQLLRSALVDVGAGWARGDLTIADEHRATSTTYRLLGQLGPLFRHRGRRRGTIVVGAFAGDPHAIPSAMMSDLLSDRRFEVIDLGANTPTESFVAVALGCDDLIGIGACAVLDGIVPMAVEQAKALRVALPDTCIVVGGPAVASGAVGFDGVVDTVSSNADEACDAFEHAAQRSDQTSDG